MPAIRAALRSPVTWRQVGYHFLAAPALAAASALAFGMWLAGLLYTLVYSYAWRLPAQSLLAHGQLAGPGRLAPMSDIPADAYLTAGGLVLLAAAPWVTAGLAALDVRITQAMLGPSRAEELEHRVERLGGADPARGTGLAGLTRRAESVDGTLEIVSPPGGPTLLTVDLPCAR